MAAITSLGTGFGGRTSLANLIGEVSLVREAIDGVLLVGLGGDCAMCALR